MKKILMVAALAAMGAGAAPVVEITSVQQQYPWTNTVDITYTSTGIESNNTYYVVFKVQDSAGKELGVITNDLKISQGSTWVAQWQPPFNVRYENCSMTPYVYKGGQDDYMIVDLETWQVSFESMSVQEASNAKYNTNDYKTKKLVLRKIPKGTYWIGDNDYSYNTRHSVNVPKDYFIGIFYCTQSQYARIVDGTTSNTSTVGAHNSWNTIRGSSGSSARPSSGIFSILNGKCKNAQTGAVLVDLNKTAVKNDATIGFDLPTRSMWEIAARAGLDTKYISGSTTTGLDKYGVQSSGSAVGTKDPNAWGIYDPVWNDFEKTRDTANSADLKTLQPNAFTPIDTGTAANFWMVGGWSSAELAFAQGHGDVKSGGWSNNSFRIAFIPE
ncbi:MAG: SUMF1/EgtB/PvdO family nonheme iron enzyme [Kiritimatiellae bacterium]|nr:SUMF1/EgtB/PvdO family nonheme iron enzyme [Kiritimatiellia bacterium]